MRLKTTGVFAFVVSLLVFGAMGQPGYAYILQNPGFEQLDGGTPIGWEAHISGVERDWESDIVQAAAEAARTGNVGAMLNGGTSFIRQRVFVQGGMHYELSAWQKGDGNGAFKFEYLDASGRTFHEESKSFTGTSEWTQVTMSTVAPDNAAEVRVFLRLNGDGTLYYDDVSFVEIGADGEPVMGGAGSTGTTLWADPDAVAEVLAGTRDEANVAWWGFDAEDSTRYIQAAINSGAPRVIIPNMGQDWIVLPISLRSNLELVFEDGVVVTAKKGEYHGRTDSVFNARNVENLIMRGYGATIRMHKDDYDNPDLYEKAEWRMGINLLGVKNVQILGLTIRDTGGDGIYLGRGSQRIHNEDIVIRDIIADNNYRQGISVITARNLLIENSLFINTGGTAPAAGIDLEPNRADEVLENIVVRNSIFENNEGHGIHISIHNLTSESQDVSLLWENLLFRGNQAGFNLWMDSDDGPAGEIVLRNCIIENTKLSGISLYNKDGDDLRVSVENCTLFNVARTPGLNLRGSSPIYFEAGPSFGGMSFDNVVVIDDRERPVVRGLLRTPLPGTFFDIDGIIDVVSPYEARIQWDGPTRDVTLELQQIDAHRIHYRQVQTLEGYQSPSLHVKVAPTLQVAPVCIRPTTNLLVNSGFEQADGENALKPASWAVHSEPGIQRMSEAARTGDFGVKMSANAGENYYVQQRVPIEGGTTYEVSAWLRALRPDGGQARLKMEFWRVDENGTTIQGEVHSEPFPLWSFEDWKEVSMQAEAPSNANSVGVLVRFFGPGEVYYDDVSLYPVECGQ